MLRKLLLVAAVAALAVIPVGGAAQAAAPAVAPGPEAVAAPVTTTEGPYCPDHPNALSLEFYAQSDIDANGRRMDIYLVPRDWGWLYPPHWVHIVYCD